MVAQALHSDGVRRIRPRASKTAAGFRDRAEVEGDPAAQDCTVSLWQDGKKLAVVTVGRDRDSLRTEAAFEDEMAS